MASLPKQVINTFWMEVGSPWRDSNCWDHLSGQLQSRLSLRRWGCLELRRETTPRHVSARVKNEVNWVTTKVGSWFSALIHPTQFSPLSDFLDPSLSLASSPSIPGKNQFQMTWLEGILGSSIWSILFSFRRWVGRGPEEGAWSRPSPWGLWPVSDFGFLRSLRIQTPEPEMDAGSTKS